NGQIASVGLKFRMVDTESEADVRVEFREDVGDTDDYAVSYAYRGHVDVSTKAPYQYLGPTVLHEILHCAGSAHEPDDHDSIMFPHAKTTVRLKAEHIRNLRRLAGITAPERFLAQIRAVL